MHSIALYVNGNDDHARMTRRTLLRYLNVTLVLVLRSISSAVKRRFPRLDHLVEAGFLTPTELEMYQSVPNVEFNTYWIPCTWFVSLLKETRRSNRISDPQGLKLIMEEFNDYRAQCGMLWSYDWVSIPLVYTQVVTIATYTFFVAAVVGRQFIEQGNKAFQMEIDIYVPVFTILQFFFYMGLLKVAEQLINPFGDDDEDFELNWLIDRHTKVSYLGVDALMTRSPPLVKDMYYNEVDLTLPYTEAAVAYKRKTYRGSVHNMFVPEEQHAMFLPEITEEDEEEAHGRKTPKSSILSLHSVGPAAGGPTEGTWRKNSDKGRKGFSLLSKVPGSHSGSVSKAVDSDAEEGPIGSLSSLRVRKTSPASPSPAGSPMPSAARMPSPFAPLPSSTQPIPPERESFTSWRSLLSSLGGRRSSSSNNSTATDSRRSSTSSVSASPKPRPRLQSCPKLLVTVGRNNSTGSTSGRKKGVRWKPVLDDGGCQKGQTSKQYSKSAGRIVNRRSAPDLFRLQTSKPSTDSGYVRDESFWRGGKFPGTPPLSDSHRSGSRFLRKMMFWKADESCGSGLVGTDPTGHVGTPMADIAPAVTRSLPNIAVHGVLGSTPSRSSIAAGPLNV